MSSPPSTVLHRFVPRRGLETTDFGYEVIAPSASVDDCIKAVKWTDSWCPDAARFVLLSLCDNVSLGTCGPLVDAIADSHFRRGIHLVCGKRILDDKALVDTFHRREVGFLLSGGDLEDIEACARRGIVGVRFDPLAIARPADESSGGCNVRDVVALTHDLGLRTIASQAATAKEVTDLLGSGFDYVSQRGTGFVPTNEKFSWHRKVV